MATRYPQAANARTITAPTRAAPPVTNATRSSRSSDMILSQTAFVSLHPVKVGDDFPGFFGRLGERNQLQVFVVDHPFVRHLREVEDRFPIVAAVENDWDRL